MTYSAMIAAALAMLNGSAQTDPATLLQTAVARIEQSTRNLKKFSCLETVERQSYAPDKSKLLMRGLSASQWLDFKDKFKLAWTDRFRLEFAVFDGVQLFSWPGARSYDRAWPQAFIGDGPSTAGEFGPFAISIFLADADPASFDKQAMPGEYRYRVPSARSHFLVRDVDQLDSATAFEGRFFVDPATGDLKRLEVEIVSPPVGSGLLNGEIIIDYERRKLGDDAVLLAVQSTAVLVSDHNEVTVNRTQYSDCREFKSVSSLVLEAAPKRLSPSQVEKPPPAALPAGIDVWTRMRTVIDTQTTFGGDRVEAEVLKAAGDGARIVIPKGALLVGRVVRLRRIFYPGKGVELALQFEYAEFDGRRVPVTLSSRGSAENPPRAKPESTGSAAKNARAWIAAFGTDRLQWKLGTRRMWRTR